jgi:hypothetical protein
LARNHKLDNAPPRDFVPARIHFDGEPPSVLWINLGDALYDEPFFDQTIERVIGNNPGPSGLTTGLDALTSFSKTRSSIRPTGFIFHMSRCGSTLVSNAFKRIGGSVVVSEASPMNVLLSPYSPDYWPCTSEQYRALQHKLLRGLINALGARRGGRERYYFIKFTSWNLLSLAAVRRAFPAVPSVFIYRDPVDVMVSNLERNSGWMQVRSSPEAAQRLFGWKSEEIGRMSAEEYCARALGKFCDVASEAADRGMLLLNYEEITERSLLKLCERLGVQVTEAEAGAVAHSLSIYSKDPQQTDAYSNDREQKRAMASAAVYEMAGRWALGPYSRLKAIRQDWLSH